jgi:gliding motility-associated-like protein
MTAGNYAVVISDTITGCSSSNMETVTVLPSPVVFAGNDVAVSLGSSVQLAAQGAGVFTWDWTPGTNLNDSTISNPLASPVITTTYVVTGSDNNGCTDKDSLIVTVNADFNLSVSNLLTPNEDGYNDKWIIQNIENYPGTKVMVVNRDGQTVFSSDSYDNTWGGTFHGKTMPDGTYYYVIQMDGSDKLYKGAITILREGNR